MRKIILLGLVLSFCLSIFGCSNNITGKENNLIVYCSHSSDIYEPIIQEFEKKTKIKVYVVHLGTGELLDRVKAEKDNALGDVMWGGSLSALSPYKEYFEQYKTENEQNIYPDYKNTDGKITSFSVVPSVLIVNQKVTKGINIESYEDLLNPELKGKIIGANPEKSSSAFEQLINQLYAMGNGNPDNGWDYISKLNENMKNDVVNSSSNVYKKVVMGDYGVGLTYEEPAVKYAKKDSNIKIVYPKEGVIAKADGVAIIKGSKQQENAKKFIDYVTGEEVQALLSKQLNRRSVRSDVKNDKSIKDVKEIKLIYDDKKWVLDNKTDIIKKYDETLGK